MSFATLEELTFVIVKIFGDNASGYVETVSKNIICTWLTATKTLLQVLKFPSSYQSSYIFKKLSATWFASLVIYFNFESILGTVSGFKGPNTNDFTQIKEIYETCKFAFTVIDHYPGKPTFYLQLTMSTVPMTKWLILWKCYQNWAAISTNKLKVSAFQRRKTKIGPISKHSMPDLRKTILRSRRSRKCLWQTAVILAQVFWIGTWKKQPSEEEPQFPNCRWS